MWPSALLRCEWTWPLTIDQLVRLWAPDAAYSLDGRRNLVVKDCALAGCFGTTRRCRWSACKAPVRGVMITAYRGQTARPLDLPVPGTVVFVVSPDRVLSHDDQVTAAEVVAASTSR